MSALLTLALVLVGASVAMRGEGNVSEVSEPVRNGHHVESGGGDTVAVSQVQASLDDPPVNVITIHALARDGVREPEPPSFNEAIPYSTDVPYEPPSAPTIPEILCSFDWPCAEATAVAYGPTANCPHGESTGNPYARNGQYLGLYQLASHWFSYYGYDVNDWADPWTNAAVAFALYEDSGWQPWSCAP